MKKVILIVRDGWGYRKSKINNAIANASTPFNDFLLRNYPNTLLDASNGAVGLPKNYQGNSEVGHITLGSGRVADESLVRINKSIKDRSFFRKKEFLDSIKNCKRNKTKLHLIGLMQTEGVHSHIDHLFALLDLCREKKFYDVYLHLFTDGRDSPINNGIKNLAKVEKKLLEVGFGKIVSISGRYYAMDRDKRWVRTKKAYKCIMNGVSKKKFNSASDPIKYSYKNKIGDEFILPSCDIGYTGVKRNDSIIFFNFRTDRMRQLIKAVVEREFSFWKRKKRFLFVVGMTEFYKSKNFRVAFRDEKMKNILGEVISKNGGKQLRISETEKYAHVTFFFNDQNEKPYSGETRILIPSPKVATYDLKPEMSVKKISSKLVGEINKEKYDFILTNLVNCDMVGHTGKTPAIKKAVRSVDDAVKKIVEAGLKKDYSILILADHGNAEDQRAKWRTSHTTNPVPCILVSNGLKNISLRKGGLSDAAPTVLKLMGIKKPNEMKGRSLL